MSGADAPSDPLASRARPGHRWNGRHVHRSHLDGQLAPLLDGLRAFERPQLIQRGGAGGGDDGLDPLIAALIQKLPETGEKWGSADRVTWLQMIAMAFQMAYGREAEITIEVKGQ